MRLTILLKSGDQNTDQNILITGSHFLALPAFLRFVYSAIFSSYLESSAVYSLFLWASTVYKHTARRLPFLLRELSDEVININIFVFM